MVLFEITAHVLKKGLFASWIARITNEEETQLLYGVFAGIFWALETVTLSAALKRASFPAAGAMAFVAPFISTFLHDLFSAVWIGGFNTIKGKPFGAFRALGTKGGKRIALAALAGGPVGMTGYVLAVNSLGSSLGAIASAVYPAIGAVLAYFVLKEKLQWYRWIFLLLTLCGVYGLSFTPGVEIENYLLGAVGALACAFGWGAEAVILAKGMGGGEVTHAFALQIRQSTSASVYAAVLLPVFLIKRGAFTETKFEQSFFALIALAALCATVSYLCYYRAITSIGAAKAMALNVTYSAWAVVFTVLICKDDSMLRPLPICCTVLVIVCGLLAGIDVRRKRDG